MPVLERIQRHQLGKLPAEDFGMTSEMVNENLRCLLILCKITTLIEAARARRIHKEVRRSAELNDKAARPRRRPVVIWTGFSRFQRDVFDVGKWKFDLVSRRVVVDVVRDACLVGRIEDDEVHRILPDTSPAADA